MALGQALADARHAAGLTQTQLAEASGVSRPTISRLEQGDSSISSDRIWDLALACGIDPATLFAEASSRLAEVGEPDQVPEPDPDVDPELKA